MRKHSLAVIPPRAANRYSARRLQGGALHGLALLCAMHGCAARADTFYAVGDIADCAQGVENSGAAQTSRWVPPEADVLLLGDVAYRNGGADPFIECYRPTWGAHDAHVWPAPGNHEYREAGADGYFRYFSAKTRPPGYYAFERGHWLLLSLNSNLAGAEFETQVEWLASLLHEERGAHRCILAYWHHPLFSSGGGEGSGEHMRRIWALLHSAHADLVLNGHEHDYEAFAPLDENGRPDSGGPQQFIVGTGGAHLGDFSAVKVGSLKRIAGKFAVLKLDLDDAGYRWSLLSDGAVLDEGSRQCVVKKSEVGMADGSLSPMPHQQAQ